MPMMRKNVVCGALNGGMMPASLCLRLVRSLPLMALGWGVGMLALTGLVWPAFAEPMSSSMTSSAQEMHEGRARFQQGGFAQAARHWMTAAHLYEDHEQPKEQCQALINLSHALQQEGQIRRAQGTLQTALKLSEQIGHRLLTATILGQL